MLIEFRVTNFRSFKEEQTLSMVAGKKDNKHPESLIPLGKLNLLKSAALYGANASGKSNLLKAMEFMVRFIRTSATRMGPEDKIPGVSPFRLSAESSKQPSIFEIVIAKDGYRYQYGFSTTVERVLSEWLIVYPPPPKRAARWIDRQYVQEKGGFDWSFRSSLKKSEEDLLREKTRGNQLALSRAADLSIEPIAGVFSSISKDLRFFDPSAGFQETAQFMKRQPSLEKRVMDIIQEVDLGIREISLAEKDILEAYPSEDDLESLLRMATEDQKEEKQFLSSYLSLRQAITSIRSKEPYRSPVLMVGTSHRMVGTEECIQFDLLQDESDGTRRFFEMIGPLLEVLDSGSLFVVDELDRSMHPLLTRKIVELFHSPRFNPKGAQIVFATHDSTLMDPGLFRRDQLWIVDKNSEGASELFSLYDFDTKKRPRDKTAFQRNYLAGRYGGIPDFGPVLENLESE